MEMSSCIFQIQGGVNLHQNMVYILGISEAITKKWNIRPITLNRAPAQQRYRRMHVVTSNAMQPG